MIPPLPGWSFEPHGTRVELLPPEGPAAGRIQYVERARPLCDVATLVEQERATSTLRVTAVGAPRPVVTREGERAALVTLACGSVRRIVGWVFLADYYSEVHALVLDARLEARFSAAVEDLVRGDSHRRRAFAFAPPPGWGGEYRGSLLDTAWRPRVPDGSLLLVSSALPRDEGLATRLLAAETTPGSGVVLERLSAPRAVVSRHGPRGAAWELWLRRSGGARHVRLVALLEDERHVYPLALETPLDRLAANRERLLAAAASVRPVLSSDPA